MKIVLLVLAIWIALPVAISFARYAPPPYSWSTAPRHSTGLAPDPSAHPEAIIQIYTARAFSWRGIFATHPWIIVKRPGAASYTRYEVMGWGGGDALKVNHSAADALWYGAAPSVLLDRRGPDAELLIGRVERAIQSYPFKDIYRTWPGPNSNTFIAHVGREVPELRLDLPANSVGKDYRPWNRPIGRAPSGGGLQLSVLGVVGATVAPEEGIEINLLGMSFGVDLLRPALRLPAIGRLGLSEAPASAR